MKKSTAKKQPELAEAGVRLQESVERMFKLETQVEAQDKILRFPHHDGSQRVAGLKDTLGSAKRAMEEAGYKLTTAKDQHEKQVAQNRSRDEVQKAKADYEAAKREFEQAERTFHYHKEKHDAVRAEFDAANSELAEFKKGCGLEHVVNFQQVLATAEQRVVELKAHIVEQERVIAEANASVPSANELVQRRQEIAADVLTGEATEAELKAVNEELQTLNKTIEAASAKRDEVLGKAEPGLLGLREKLAEAEQELKELNSQKPEMARLFLKAQASLVYSDYLKLGKELGEKFVKLMSLNALICSIPERRHIDHSILLMASVMKIPRFKIGPDAEAPSMSTVFAAAEQRIDLAREVEKARLKAEGLTLLD